MNRREHVAIFVLITIFVGVAGCLLGAVRVGVLSLTEVTVLVLEGAVVGGGVALSTLVAVWGFGPRVRGWLYRHRIPRVMGTDGIGLTSSVRIVPLPHKKGFIKPKLRIEVRKSQRTAWMTEEDRLTHPEAAEASQAQLWDAAVPMVDTVTAGRGRETGILKSSQTRSLVYKFGVVRVTAIGGPLVNCHATATIMRVIGKGRARTIGPGYGLGTLPWASRSARQQVLGDMRRTRELLNNPDEGLNDLLNRHEEKRVNINGGTSRDLQLFYMCNMSSHVFPCGEELGRRIGESESRRVVRFQIDLNLSASNLPTSETRKFAATARWDEFTLREIP